MVYFRQITHLFITLRSTIQDMLTPVTILTYLRSINIMIENRELDLINFDHTPMKDLLVPMKSRVSREYFNLNAYISKQHDIRLPSQ